MGVGAEGLRFGVRDLWGIEVDLTTASRLITRFGRNADDGLQPADLDLKRMEIVLNQVVAESQAAKAEQANEFQKQQDDALQKATAKALKASEEATTIARVGSVFAYVLPTLGTFRFSQALVHFPWAAPILSVLDSGNQILYGSLFGIGGLIIFIAMQMMSTDTIQPFLLRFNM